MKPFSKNALAMPRSKIRDIMHMAMEMDGVIHLEVGEPDFPTPEHVVDSACYSAKNGFTKYAPNAGLNSLRMAIANKLRRYNKIDANIENVTVTSSGVCAIATSLMALMESDEEILIPDLSWPDYDMIIAINGWKQIRYPLLKDKGFLPNMKALRSLITDKSKILVINSPSNPTGAVFPRSIQQEMVEIVSEYDLYLMSDETYDQIIFDGEHVSPAIYDKEGRVLSIFSFSKVYAMTGWRVGYVCASPSLSRLIADIQEPYVSCACTVSQKAAESALTGPQDCQKIMVDAYRKRRDIAVEILKENDMFVYSPQGAIYMLIDISQSGMSSHEFTMSLLEKERVAVSPGDTFGQHGKDYIRICFAVSEDNLKEALNRICRHVRRNA